VSTPSIDSPGASVRPYQGNAASAAEIYQQGGNSAAGIIKGQQDNRQPLKVYMGKDYENPTPSIPHRDAGKNGSATALWTTDNALDYWNWMDQGERDKLYAATMVMGGYVNDYNARALWQDAVDGAQARTAATGKLTSPWDYLEQISKRSSQVSGGPGGGGSKTSITVDLTNPGDAQAVLTDAYTAILGRAPDDAEQAKFLADLNKTEKKNPIVSGPTSRSGGVNSAQAAIETAQADPSAGETAVQSKYMNWLMEGVKTDQAQGVESGI